MKVEFMGPLFFDRIIRIQACASIRLPINHFFEAVHESINTKAPK